MMSSRMNGVYLFVFVVTLLCFCGVRNLLLSAETPEAKTQQFKTIYLDRSRGLGWLEFPDSSIQRIQLERNEGWLKTNEFYQFSYVGDLDYHFLESSLVLEKSRKFKSKGYARFDEFDDFPNEVDLLYFEGLVVKQIKEDDDHLKLKIQFDGRFCWATLLVEGFADSVDLVDREISLTCVYVPGKKYRSPTVVDGECWISSVNDLSPLDGLGVFVHDLSESYETRGVEVIKDLQRLRDFLTEGSDFDLHPVELDGMVVGLDTQLKHLFLLNNSEVFSVPWDFGISVPVRGQEISISGTVSISGKDKGSFNVDHFDFGSIHDLPAPQLAHLGSIVSGRGIHQQWMALNAYVASIRVESGQTILDLVSGKSRGSARVLFPFVDDIQVGAIYRIRGSSTLSKDKSNAVAEYQFQIFDLSDMTFRRNVKEHPFRSARNVNRLNLYDENPNDIIWGKFTGVLTATYDEKQLFVQNKSRSIRVNLCEAVSGVNVGDTVEVAGVASFANQQIVLHSAIVEKSKNIKSLKPILIRGFDDFIPLSGGEWIQVQGNVLGFSVRDEQALLTLHFDNGTCDVIVSNDLGMNRLRSGSYVSVEGVYNPLIDQFGNLSSYSVLMSELSAFEIISRVSWWNASRIGILTLLLLIMISLGAVWILTLRRRVRIQTDEIKNRLKFERDIWSVNYDIVRNASDFIFTTNALNRINTVNPYVKDLIGEEPENLIGKNYTELFLEEDGSPIVIHEDLYETYTKRCLVKSPDRGDVWVELSLRLFVDHTHKTGILGIARDISKNKEYEDALNSARRIAVENAKSKSVFLANMSHEIRTPMNGIVGMGNLLLDTKLTDEQRNFAQIICSSSEALLGIINDILDLSKIEAGKLTFESIPFSIQRLVEDTVDLLLPKALEQELKLLVNISTEMPGRFLGDPSRVRQVLVNILGNAIKFTETGEILVNVYIHDQIDGRFSIVFKIKDTGIGIPADRIDNLFTPFEQTDGSMNRKFGGTGLGLSISKHLVELMGGHIRCESILNEGSTFIFTIPFEQYVESKPSGLATSSDALFGSRALIVDEHLTHRSIIQKYASALGIQCFEAESCKDAQSVISDSDPFDFLIVDFDCVSQVGAGFFRFLRTDDKTKKSSIVLMTNLDNRMSPSELKERGIDACLSLPIRQSSLLSTLARLKNIPLGNQESFLSRELPDSKLSGNILIVEDNVVNQKVASLQLGKMGLHVDVVTGGAECLDAIQSQEYDLIFMDCQMPDMDGYECTEKIREQERYKDLPIVAMTAHVLDGDRQRCFEVGMNDYISKPVRPCELRDVLSRFGIQ